MRTRRGLRLSQHGVVISELRTSPGPTHSVFDVLAALVAVLQPPSRVGLLGFAGGGMMAPLHGLNVKTLIEAVDLDAESYQLFRKHCPEWAAQVNWQHGDAVEWLRRQHTRFDMLIEDLSVPSDGDVFKPEVSWTVLPELIRRRLQPRGVAIFNLMPPAEGAWRTKLLSLARLFSASRLVSFDEYENAILIAGQQLPSTRNLGHRLRSSLGQLRSRQAERIHIKKIALPDASGRAVT